MGAGQHREVKKTQRKPKKARAEKPLVPESTWVRTAGWRSVKSFQRRNDPKNRNLPSFLEKVPIVNVEFGSVQKMCVNLNISKNVSFFTIDI